MNAEEQAAQRIPSREVVGHSRGDVRDLPVKRYDFRKPEKFTHEQIRAITLIHETFARLNTAVLSEQLGAAVEIRLDSVDQITFGEYIGSTPNPCMLAVVNMDPLKGNAVLGIDPALTFAMMERMIGGSTETPVADREHTEMELSVLEGLIVRMLGNLRDAWLMATDLRPRLTQIETIPEYAQVVPPPEMVAIVSMAAQIGSIAGTINLCIPHATIEQILSKLSILYMYSTNRNSTAARKAPEGYGTDIPVDVEVCIEAPEMSLRELAELRSGDMIPLEQWDAGHLFLNAGGVRLSCEIVSLDEEGLKLSMADSTPSRGESEVFGGEDVGKLLAEPVTLLREEIHRGFAALSKQIGGLQKAPDATEEEPEGSPQHGQDESQEDGSFGFLRPGDGEALRAVIENEHPQMIAFVLTRIDTALASYVVECLGPEVQAEVAERIYRIGDVLPEVTNAVHRVLRVKMRGFAGTETGDTIGESRLADILAQVSTCTQVLAALARISPEIAAEMEKRLSERGTEAV